ncbi:MAG: Response regulator receiver protein [Parcubacteria group bacterium GW2011_GWC1_42_11]|uniref:Response regulator receiver protein n=1 Tax=Candidatus Nomurabacteria bacterium GW2011_GWC2_42_20 TaxID=1618756 RepID=A0A0G1CBA1_9BACT|nr:MAG: Response regulator receiver protein [Parcubacteria group bacterium GW2011_GWC1_42_11]KKS46923.1 MAG: Response regulator receiver protein [Candidatus Nomurabacteria bacterium GW2011_GWC2_42_20]KKS58927.1 MAG: Response regulator receiver protein [Candidatus Nomurabacteria bacterium GW2011_GWA2_42_41]KKT09444.1 MAG: Response regulator receiver protein [Candidatus Nomurabacteria bacterium GW2011_GWB1_43_20]TAN35691.1 MAG: response regulator [Patescibacteria group bacterium]HBH71305.1 respo
MNHVLVVEDEDFLVRALKDNLVSEGHSVSVATDGEMAFDELKKKKPSLILLDLLLPKKNGFDVLRDIRSNPEWQHIPVVILSNLGEDSEIKRALELGANDYFVKSQHPIQEVMEKVREYLQGAGAR